MLCVVVITAVHLNGLMIFRIENLTRQVIGLNRTNGCMFFLGRFCLNSGITGDDVTQVCLFAVRIEPSAETPGHALNRQQAYIRQGIQRSAFDSLYAEQFGTSLVFENHLARRHLRCFRKEIGHVGITCQFKRQCTCPAGVGVGHVLCIVRLLLTARSVVAEVQQLLAVFLDNDRRAAVLACTDGEFYRPVNGHRDYTAEDTVLAAIVACAFYGYTCRQLAIFGQQYRVRVVAELNLEVLERTHDVLLELNLAQHSFGTGLAFNIHTFHICSQVNRGIPTEIDILRISNLVAFYRIDSFCFRCIVHRNSIRCLRLSVSESQFEFAGYSSLLKICPAFTVQLDTVQAVVAAFHAVINLCAVIQSVVRISTRSFLRVIPQQVISAGQHSYAHQSRSQKRKDFLHKYVDFSY